MADPNSIVFATGGYDHFIKFWHPQDGVCYRTAVVHTRTYTHTHTHTYTHTHTHTHTDTRGGCGSAQCPHRPRRSVSGSCEQQGKDGGREGRMDGWVLIPYLRCHTAGNSNWISSAFPLSDCYLLSPSLFEEVNIILQAINNCVLVPCRVCVTYGA